MLKSQNYSSLENQFLLAMPQLGGSYFEDSVTYLWKHTAEGAIGIVINKPLQYTEMDIFKELEINSGVVLLLLIIKYLQWDQLF